VTAGIVALQLDSSPDLSPRPASALLSSRALDVLKGRADYLGWPEGQGDPALQVAASDPWEAELDDSIEPPNDRSRAGLRSPPAAPWDDEATDSTTAVPLTNPEDADAQSEPIGRRGYGPPRSSRASEQPPDDDAPPDEVDVTWLERPWPPQRSTDAQTPATPLRPNRSAGERRLDGSVHRR
jgi:hypothetical protein